MNRETLVIVERSFDEPTTFEDIDGAERAAFFCLEERNVRPLRSYLSLDRRSMVCMYLAPDAESVREAQRRARLPLVRVWSAEVFVPAGPPRAEPNLETIVVEREFSEPVDIGSVQQTLSEGHFCLENHRADLRVSHLSLDGLRMLCVFEAPDAESVRRANRQLGVPVTRAWTAEVYGAR